MALVFPAAMVAALQLQLQLELELELESILLLAPVLAPAAVEDEVVPGQPEAMVVFVFVSEAVVVPVLFNFTTALKAYPPPTPIYVYEEANRFRRGSLSASTALMKMKKFTKRGIRIAWCFEYNLSHMTYRSCDQLPITNTNYSHPLLCL